MNKGFREESKVRDGSVAQMWSAVSSTVSLLCCAVVLVIGSILLSFWCACCCDVASEVSKAVTPVVRDLCALDMLFNTETVEQYSSYCGSTRQIYYIGVYKCRSASPSELRNSPPI